MGVRGELDAEPFGDVGGGRARLVLAFVLYRVGLVANDGLDDVRAWRCSSVISSSRMNRMTASLSVFGPV